MRKFISTFFAMALLSACGDFIPLAGLVHNQATLPAGEAALDETARFNEQVRIAADGLRQQEQFALRHGRPLRDYETRLAVLAGVENPSKIRVLLVKEIPVSPSLGIKPEQILGLTSGYGVFIRSDIASVEGVYDEVLAHEFVHVSQFERFGFEGMASRFFDQKRLYGDKAIIPIEAEAIRRGLLVYDDPRIGYGL